MNAMRQIIEREQRSTRPRRTALPASAFLRPLACARCAETVDVFEANLGARTDDEHRFLDPATYICGQCMEPKL